MPYIDADVGQTYAFANSAVRDLVCIITMELTRTLASCLFVDQQGTILRRPLENGSPAPGLSITSSLRGAVNDINMSSLSQHSGSPSPTSDGSTHYGSHHRTRSYNATSGIVWTHSPSDGQTQTALHHATYPSVHNQNMPFHGISSQSAHTHAATSNAYTPYQQYNTSSGSNLPDSAPSGHSTMFGASSYPEHYGYSQDRPSTSLGEQVMITPQSD